MDEPSQGKSKKATSHKHSNHVPHPSTIPASPIRKSRATSKCNTQYFCVPPLKAIITHKITSWVYEDNVNLDLTPLNSDILEYMVSKMPFCVVHRICEMKLAGNAIDLDFIKRFASTKQFEDETRSILQKVLRIKHETKLGLWIAYRRSALRDPSTTCLFWREFCERECDIRRRELAKRCAEPKQGAGNKTEDIVEWGRKHFADWEGWKGKDKGKTKGKAGGGRKIMFHEYYDLVVAMTEKHKIENVPLFLINKIDIGLNEKILRDLEAEIKAFILKMKMLTNDFLPLRYQRVTFAPLPIWLRLSPQNKDHKYVRSRTNLILSQRQASSSSSSSSSLSCSIPPSALPLPSSIGKDARDAQTRDEGTHDEQDAHDAQGGEALCDNDVEGSDNNSDHE